MAWKRPLPRAIFNVYDRFVFGAEERRQLRVLAMDDPCGSVSRYLIALRRGDEEAAAALWKRYFARLAKLARSRLHDRFRRVSDEEDIALSAFDSFVRSAREGRFPDLNDRHDLWQVLVMIAARKSTAVLRRESRQKRGRGRVRGHSALLNRGAEDSRDDWWAAVGEQPTPELAATLAEDFSVLLERLNDENLRRIALWKLEGYSNQEIAHRLNRQPRTVERKLHLIRAIWWQTVGEGA